MTSKKSEGERQQHIGQSKGHETSTFRPRKNSRNGKVFDPGALLEDDECSNKSSIPNSSKNEVRYVGFVGKKRTIL
jgi:hypothetical protein